MTADSATPGLHWSIKRAFVLYVARIADGQILGSPGLQMIDASTFVWAPTSSPAAQPGAGTRLAFRGAVRFGAHNGALAFQVADPWIEITAERSHLSIAGEASARIPFVEFTAQEDVDDGSSRGWRGTDVRLSEAALPLFAGYYGAGEAFDDLRIVLPPA